MPRIPELNEQQRLGQMGPIEIASGSEAAIAGESVARLGAQISASAGKIGGAFAEVFEERRKIQQGLDVAKNQNELQAKGLEAFTAAMRDSKPDGSDMQKMFDDSYEKVRKDQLKLISDDETKQFVDVSAGQIRNSFAQRIQAQSFNKGVAHGLQSGESLVNQASAQIRTNPGLHGEVLERTKLVLGQAKNLFGPDNMEKINKLLEVESAEARWQGFAEQGKFDQARKVLGPLDQGGLYDSGERLKRFEKIDQMQTQKMEREYAEVVRTNQLDTMKQKKMSQQFFQSASKAVFEAEDEVSREKVEKSLNEGLSAGFVDNADYKFLLGLNKQNITDKPGDSRFELEMLDRMFKGESVEKLQSEVMTAFDVNKSIGSDVARSLTIRFQESLNTRLSAQDSANHKVLQARTIKGGVWGRWSQAEDNARYGQAMRAYQEARRTGSPEMALSIALKKHAMQGIRKGEVANIPDVPASLQNSVEVLGDDGPAQKTIENLLRQGKITDAQADDYTAKRKFKLSVEKGEIKEPREPE